MKAAGLISFATMLRSAVGVEDRAKCSVSLKYGDSIDQDHETTTLMDWHTSEGSTWSTIKEYQWDKKVKEIPWSKLQSKFLRDNKTIYRGHLRLGSLKHESCAALSRSSAADPQCGIYPDSLSISIDPVCPSTLSDEEEPVYTGLVSIRFSGNGYFTWGPHWSDYAEQYKAAAPIQVARRLTRTHFPVRRDDSVEKIAGHLGPRFLNRDYYEDGDWILSVSESG